MKILQLCNKIPYPVVDGGTAAMNQISEGLISCGNNLKVLAAHTHKQNFSEKELSEQYKKKFHPEYVFINTKINLMDAFLNLFSRESYNVKRFDQSDFHLKVKNVLSEASYDAVILDSLFVTPYITTIRENSKAKIILRAHNVEHKVWERKSGQESNPVKKAYLKILTSRLKKYEEKIIPRVDGVAAISLEDYDYFKNNFSVPVEFIPFGFSNQPTPNFEEFASNKAYFLGSMDWEPNLQASDWIIENLHSELKAMGNNFSITLAGNKMPLKYFEFTDQNLHVFGKIENASDFIRNYGVMIAPLYSGGGLKIKIVEAMAHGKIVLTTNVGAEGIGLTADQHFLLCNTKDEFIKAIKICSTEKQKAYEIAQAGQKFIQENFNLTEIMKSFNSFISSLQVANQN